MLDKAEMLHMLELMRKAVGEAGKPNHYAGDLLWDASLVLKYGMTKFLWCLRECGTFIIALKSDKEMSVFDIGYDSKGMEMYPEARFFIVDNDASEPYEITYEKAMQKVKKIEEGLEERKHVCNY